MGKPTKTLRVVNSRSTPAEPGHRIGRVVGVQMGQWLVECGAPSGPRPARTTLALDPQAREDAAQARREALIVFQDNDLERPIVIGLLEEPPMAAEPPEARAAKLEALVDGERVVVEAKDEIVLRCGEASITLRRNGRVVVRGTYVETRSRGVNRIKGGSVQIN